MHEELTKQFSSYLFSEILLAFYKTVIEQQLLCVMLPQTEYKNVEPQRHQ